jgi:hypothetical protein
VSERYWLYDWLDEFHIQNVDTARLLLKNPAAVDELRSRASAARLPLPEARFAGEKILAGRGIDLSGRLDCDHPDCRRRQIETLFSRVWHYFDRIVVEDAVTHEVSAHWEEGPSQVAEWVLSHVSVLLVLRELGADRLVEFREKPPACEVHLRQHALEAGLAGVLDSLEVLTDALQAESTFAVTPHANGSVSVRIDHPAFEHTQWRTLDASVTRNLPSREVQRLALTAVIKTFVAHLTADVSAAQRYHLPLGAVVGLHRRLLERSDTPGVADVAFSLSLPVVEGIPVRTLLAIREQEQEHFAKFQQALRKAITEMLKIAGSEKADVLAGEIQRDLIDASINQIRGRLAASQRALTKKAGLGIFLGGLATTCGLLCGAQAPMAISTGVATAIAVTSSAATSHVDQTREIEQSEMYFAWRAIQHAKH